MIVKIRQAQPAAKDDIPLDLWLFVVPACMRQICRQRPYFNPLRVLSALSQVFTGIIINAFQHDANDGQPSKHDEEYSDGSDEEGDSKSIEE